MLDPVFLEAWTHRSGGHVVLSRRLHALSALDLLALEAVNSPFLYDGAKCEIPDLILAVWILSNPHAEDLTVGHLELNADGEAWLKTLEGKIDLKRDSEAIGAYMKDYYSLPKVFRTVASSPVTALGAPWMLATITAVVSALHISLREAWTMGIGQLFWYRASLEEQESDSRIISPSMREEMEKAEGSSKSFTLGIGESLEDFSRRTGIPEYDAAVLLHNQSVRSN